MTNELCLMERALECMWDSRWFVSLLFLAGALVRLVEIVVEPVEAAFPMFAVGLHPLHRFAHGLRFQAAGPPLCLAALADQPGALQHLEMLGDRRETDVERLSQLTHRGLARGEPREDGAARRIRQRGKGDAEVI